LTLAEKILAAHADEREVSPGEFVNVRVDLILANDITAPIAIKEFQKIGVGRVFDPQKVVMVPDHFVPNKDIASAEQAKLMREFAYEQGIIYFEVGQSGIRALSMCFCLSRVWCCPGRWLSGLIHTPVPMVL